MITTTPDTTTNKSSLYSSFKKEEDYIRNDAQTVKNKVFKNKHGTTTQPTNQVCILPLKKINILNSNVAQTENKKIKNV